MRQVLKTIRGIVFLSNAAYPAMSYTQAQLLQLFRHSGAAIAALAQSVLIADMCQKHHIAPLPMGYRAVFPSPKTTISDPHHAAGMRPGKESPIVIQKRELHGFWAAKNWFDRRQRARTNGASLATP